jgi:hypothetical protein
MGYALALIALVLVLIFLAFALLRMGGAPGAARRRDRASEPHAEKEQMDKPQEEFREANETPSRTHPAP